MEEVKATATPALGVKVATKTEEEVAPVGLSDITYASIDTFLLSPLFSSIFLHTHLTIDTALRYATLL